MRMIQHVYASTIHKKIVEMRQTSKMIILLSRLLIRISPKAVRDVFLKSPQVYRNTHRQLKERKIISIQLLNKNYRVPSSKWFKMKDSKERSNLWVDMIILRVTWTQRLTQKNNKGNTRDLINQIGLMPINIISQKSSRKKKVQRVAKDRAR